MGNTPNGGWGIVKSDLSAAILNDFDAPRMNLIKQNSTECAARRILTTYVVGWI
jgi:hypothetical protein